jgi:hypothetical protein
MNSTHVNRKFDYAEGKEIGPEGATEGKEKEKKRGKERDSN